jgi:hypothetical protein
MSLDERRVAYTDTQGDAYVGPDRPKREPAMTHLPRSRCSR